MATITVGPTGRCPDLNDTDWHTIYEDAEGCSAFRAECEDGSAAGIQVRVSGLHTATGPGESLRIASGKQVWRRGVRGITKAEVRRDPIATGICKFNWSVAAIVPWDSQWSRGGNG